MSLAPNCWAEFLGWISEWTWCKNWFVSTLQIKQCHWVTNLFVLLLQICVWFRSWKSDYSLTAEWTRWNIWWQIERVRLTSRNFKDQGLKNGGIGFWQKLQEKAKYFGTLGLANHSQCLPEFQTSSISSIYPVQCIAMIACEATNHWTLGWVTLRDVAKIARFQQLILSLETARSFQSLSKSL